MIGVAGSGAFGTALSVVLARGGAEVRLWGRDRAACAAMQRDRTNATYLPGVALPPTVAVTAELADLRQAHLVLLCLPMQRLAPFLASATDLPVGVPLVACCKGVDFATLQGPVALIRSLRPDATAAILTGPSFATDIAHGLPTALTLGADASVGQFLQERLSTPTLRVYWTDDVTGAELGGALKNVIAIAAGIVIGLGLGESARAALITRGYAEMVRLALRLGARSETLSGLSGLGDLMLTCTSQQSRNFRLGLALGQGQNFDPGVTVEGVATAKAVTALATKLGLEMPISTMVSAIVEGTVQVGDAIPTLMARPLKKE